MKRHRHLSYEDRCQIAALLKRGVSQAGIARDIGVHRATISRELQRNSQPTGCYHNLAQSQAEDRQAKRDSRVRKMKDKLLRFVESRLREDWSPQQISGWLRYRQDRLPCISHERIYQHVWLDKFDSGTLHTHLRHRGRRYWRRGSSYERRGRIPGRVDIDQRPAIVKQKIRVGDWEVDTIAGPTGQRGALVSMADRCSKLIRLSRVPSRHAPLVADAIETRLGEHPERVLTLTMDNGLEFARHRSFGGALGADTYFAKSYQSWQRGLNEHSNGLVRQYFPKATDFSTVSEEAVRKVEVLLNNRLRAALGYRTPLEVFDAPPVDPGVALAT